MIYAVVTLLVIAVVVESYVWGEYLIGAFHAYIRTDGESYEPNENDWNAEVSMDPRSLSYLQYLNNEDCQ